MRARWVEEVESFNLEWKERSMATIRVHDRDGKGRARLVKVASLVLGLAMFGTVGLSGTLAQENGMAAGSDAESIVNSIIQQVFGEIFGGGGVDDNAGVSGGGNIEVGGNSGSNVTMGGSGGGMSIGSGGSGSGGSGGSGGGAMMGDDSAVYP
jgi:hypothetical protein